MLLTEQHSNHMHPTRQAGRNKEGTYIYVRSTVAKSRQLSLQEMSQQHIFECGFSVGLLGCDFYVSYQ